MYNVSKNLKVLVTITCLTSFSFGCSSVSPSHLSEQNGLNPENSIEIECGAQTLVVQTDKLPEEQRKHLEKLESETRTFGCSSVSPSHLSEQNGLNPENSIEIECGAQTLVVQTDNLPEEQRKHLEKLETRC